MMAGAYCRYCDTRCFVLRTIPDGPRKGWSGHMATCARGMVNDLAELGYTCQTAVNPANDLVALPTGSPTVTAPPEALLPLTAFLWGGWRRFEGLAVDATPLARELFEAGAGYAVAADLEALAASVRQARPEVVPSTQPRSEWACGVAWALDLLEARADQLRAVAKLNAPTLPGKRP